MSNTIIKTKRSMTANAVPANGSLSVGELAVNIIDKKMWIGTSTEGSAPVLLLDYALFASSSGEGFTYFEGPGINISAEEIISLDLLTITASDTTAVKGDKIPFLDVSSGTTELITVQNLFRNALQYAISTIPLSGNNDESITIGLQDNNPSAFAITIVGGTGVKDDIIKIDTEGIEALVTLKGSYVDIAPTEQLTLGGGGIPTIMASTDIRLDANSTIVDFSADNGTLTGLTTINVGESSTDTLTINGNLTVSGITTTINSTTLTVDDKNIELGSVASPTDVTADGGGITLKGASNKTLNWVNATDAWTSSEHIELASGKAFYINGTSVLNGTTLGTGVTASSLTSVGTLANLTVTNTIAASVNGNAATATSLLNTRAIALGGEASGSTNFDGSTNITITTTIPLLDGGNY